MTKTTKSNKTEPQKKFHVKKGDEVVVFTGKLRYVREDKAAKGEDEETGRQKKRGKVLQVLRKKNRVLIEGVNLIKKTQRRSQDNPQGGISVLEASVPISNVMLAAEYDRRYGKKTAAKA